jgi:hypothetical protein
MSGTKSPDVQSKYIRRTRAKLARRIAQYEESLKKAKHPRGLHKPGSHSTRKGG